MKLSEIASQRKYILYFNVEGVLDAEKKEGNDVQSLINFAESNDANQFEIFVSTPYDFQTETPENLILWYDRFNDGKWSRMANLDDNIAKKRLQGIKIPPSVDTPVGSVYMNEIVNPLDMQHFNNQLYIFVNDDHTPHTKYILFLPNGDMYVFGEHNHQIVATFVNNVGNAAKVMDRASFIWAMRNHFGNELGIETKLEKLPTPIQKFVLNKMKEDKAPIHMSRVGPLFMNENNINEFKIMKLIHLLKEETNPAFRIYDNGGESADRYTLITAEGDVFGFDENPFHPQGFGQYTGNYHEWQSDWTPDHLGKPIAFNQLPPKAQEYVKDILGVGAVGNIPSQAQLVPTPLGTGAASMNESADLEEKAVSKKQQKFFGMVHAAQKGEKPASPEVAKVAKSISKSDAKDFAATKHKGLPEKKKKNRRKKNALNEEYAIENPHYEICIGFMKLAKHRLGGMAVFAIQDDDTYGKQIGADYLVELSHGVDQYVLVPYGNNNYIINHNPLFNIRYMKVNPETRAYYILNDEFDEGGKFAYWGKYQELIIDPDRRWSPNSDTASFKYKIEKLKREGATFYFGDEAMEHDVFNKQQEEKPEEMKEDNLWMKNAPLSADNNIGEETKKWMSPKPEQCDICSAPITTWWVDGKTSFGPWGNMCPNCFRKYGVGLGMGKGQKYDANTLEKIGEVKINYDDDTVTQSEKQIQNMYGEHEPIVEVRSRGGRARMRASQWKKLQENLKTAEESADPVLEIRNRGGRMKMRESQWKTLQENLKRLKERPEAIQEELNQIKQKMNISNSKLI